MSQGIDGRNIVFAAVVAVLAAVGVYLLVAPDPQEETAGSSGTPAARRGEGTAAPLPSGSAAPSAAPTVNPEDFDVYAYLPWSREQLAASADVARRFLAQYATHRHDEDPVSYADRLKSFTTQELASSLARTVTDPRRVEQERADRVVSEGTARIRQLRTFGENSITWVGTATERITATSGRREVVQEYAVTTIQVGDAWKVYDFNLAEAGQAGDDAGPEPGGSDGEERAE